MKNTRLRTSVISTAVLAIAALRVHGGDYAFEVPDLIGSYLGDDAHAQPPVHVTLDLGMTFAEIESVSLRIGGYQDAGLFGDLNQEGEWPLSADLFASLTDGQSNWAAAESILDAVDGDFDVTQSFRGSYLSPAVDFSHWYDGTADFDFAAATPPMIATTYLIEMPAVDITSAELIISGQADLDTFMIDGDFNADGNVDGADGDLWQSALGASADADADLTGMTEGSDFLIWQRNVVASVNVVIPEPECLTLMLLAAASLRWRNRD